MTLPFFTYWLISKNYYIFKRSVQLLSDIYTCSQAYSLLELLCAQKQEQIKITMIQKVSSEGELPEEGELNQQSNYDNNSETASIKTASNHSERESSVGKGRPIARRPDNHRSNFEAYKQIKRKSQQKEMQQPPRYPRCSQDSKADPAPTPQTGPSEEPSLISSAASPSSKADSAVRFKKKALSKQQIIEIKDYMSSLDLDKLETNSIATSEKAPKDVRHDQLIKEANKKSKTQYFHPEEIQGRHTQQHDVPSSSSENEIQLTSLKEKCQSVDYANTLLQKQLKWIRSEVQMHLERQEEFKKTKLSLEAQLKEKDKLLDQQKQINQKLSRQLTSKNSQMIKMRELIVELNLRCDNDREILISEIEYLKSEKDSELEAQEKAYEVRIKQLQSSLQAIKQERVQTVEPQGKEGESYFTRMIEKLVSQNKYLKMQNHMLARYKQDLCQLKTQNKKIANERDTLKKKIIENAKKQAMRMRMFEDSDNSSINSLSELTYSLSHLRP